MKGIKKKIPAKCYHIETIMVSILSYSLLYLSATPRNIHD